MSQRIIVSDVRTALASLPDQSVQTCITSPPYFGLRDYGTATWDGGDPECVHAGVGPVVGNNSSIRGQNEMTRPIGVTKKAADDGHQRSVVPPGGQCVKCGATRIDQQIGIEPTVSAYIETLVAVFREVRRVLHDTGTLFLNLGDAYASGSQRGAGNGTSGTVPPGCLDRDSFSQSPGDGPQRSESNHSERTRDSLVRGRVVELLEQSRSSMAALFAHLPSADSSHRQPTWQPSGATPDLVRDAIHAAEPLLDVLASTMTGYALPPQDAQMPDDIASAFLWSLRSFVAGARQFADILAGYRETSERTSGIASCAVRSAARSQCTVDVAYSELETRERTADIALLVAELAVRIRCTVACCSMFASWLNIGEVQPQYTSLAPKNLMGVPWRVALALQADGWTLRSAMPWIKRSAMPESCTDRPTTAIEYVFLLTKRPRYFWDSDAVRRSAEERRLSSWNDRRNAGEPIRRGDPGLSGHVTTTATLASTPGRNMRNSDFWFDSLDDLIAQERAYLADLEAMRERGGLLLDEGGDPLALDIKTAAYKNAHFATFPTALVEPCIKAGSRAGDTVLDPFLGAGTTLLVADRLGRHGVGIELSPTYAALALNRVRDDAPMFADVAVEQLR